MGIALEIVQVQAEASENVLDFPALFEVTRRQDQNPSHDAKTLPIPLYRKEPRAGL